MYLVLTFYKNVSKECVLALTKGSRSKRQLKTTLYGV